MHIASIVEKVDGKYIARVIGEPCLRGEGDTRVCAVKALKDTLFMKHFSKEIAMIDVQLGDLFQLVSDSTGGVYDAEEAEAEIQAIYAERERSKLEEFPE